MRGKHMRESRGGTGVWTPLKITKNIEFLSNTDPDPLKNHKATKKTFNVGPSSARQRNAIKMPFRWRHRHANSGKMPFRWRHLHANSGILTLPPLIKLKKKSIFANFLVLLFFSVTIFVTLLEIIEILSTTLINSSIFLYFTLL